MDAVKRQWAREIVELDCSCDEECDACMFEIAERVLRIAKSKPARATRVKIVTNHPIGAEAYMGFIFKYLCSAGQAETYLKHDVEWDGDIAEILVAPADAVAAAKAVDAGFYDYFNIKRKGI